MKPYTKNQIKKFPVVNEQELANKKDTIGNYHVEVNYLGLGVTTGLRVHVGLASQNHYKTITELVHQELGKSSQVVKVLMDNRKGFNFGIGTPNSGDLDE